MFDLGAAGRGITVMGHCVVALESAYEFVVEDLRYEPHALVYHHRLAVGGSDARTFLPTVLEREEPEKGESRDFESLTVDSEDRTFFSLNFHREVRIIPLQGPQREALIRTEVDSNLLLKKPQQYGFLHVLAVFRLVEDD